TDAASGVGVGIAKRDLEGASTGGPWVTAGRVGRTVPRCRAACQGRGAVVPTGASETSRRVPHSSGVGARGPARVAGVRGRRVRRRTAVADATDRARLV